eukprot:12906168-Prorocentrum_lima.AAC.1
MMTEDMSKQRCLPTNWKGNVESTWPFQQYVEGSLPLSMCNGMWAEGVSLPWQDGVCPRRQIAADMSKQVHLLHKCSQA